MGNRYNKKFEGCSIDGCAGKHYALSFCRSHWDRNNRTGSPVRPIKTARADQTCAFEECNNPQRSLALCVAHYQQQYLGHELRPLQAYRVLLQTEEGRICTTCERFKPWMEYYRSSDGKRYKAKCKRCVINKTREREAT